MKRSRAAWALAALLAGSAGAAAADPAARAACLEGAGAAGGAEAGVIACTRALAAPDLDAGAQAALRAARAERHAAGLRFRAARADLEAALAAPAEAGGPPRAALLTRLGVVHGEMRDYAAAEAAFDAALGEDPGWTPARLGRAHARGLAGDLDGAIADYDAALAAGPDDADAAEARAIALGARAWARWREGDPRGGAADAAAGLEALPDEPELWDTLAHARASLGDAAGALAAFERALALTQGPARAEAYAAALARKGHPLEPGGPPDAALRAALLACAQADCRLME